MSTTSKLVLASACATTFGIIGYVHYKQKDDRWVCIVLYDLWLNLLKNFIINIYCSDKLHEGVVRDWERQQARKRENTYLLQQQIDLTKQLKNDWMRISIGCSGW